MTKKINRKDFHRFQRSLCLDELNYWLKDGAYHIVSICEQYESSSIASNIYFCGLSVYYYD